MQKFIVLFQTFGIIWSWTNLRSEIKTHAHPAGRIFGGVPNGRQLSVPIGSAGSGPCNLL